MQSPIDDGVVLVTGASSGIGREIARQVAPRAKALVLVARRRERLEELRRELTEARPGLDVVVEVRDLAEPGASAALVAAVRERVGEVDVLVNNAGVGDMGVFDQCDPVRLERMIALNVTSVALLTRALVNPMVARRRGGVLNVSSGFGVAFLAGFAGYIGTKHFMTGFSEALRADLTGTGVRVTQVCPGPVSSEFEENIGNFTGRKMPRFLEIAPSLCARIAIKAFDRCRAMYIPGSAVWLLLTMTRHAPLFAVRIVANAVGRLLRRMQLRRAASASPHG